ncbi:MAG: restriction endonuclease subunit S [Acidobacteria bacterium]|nr:restriction endonuclease subunit S [Acidobacteriota bacterium]
MASEWPIMSLREAGVSLIDCEHRTPPASERGYPYVAIPQVKDGRINLNGVRRITRKHFDEWTRKAHPEPFDVVLSRRCNPGETGFVPRGLQFALGQNLVLLRSDGTKIFKPFLRWLVRGPQWWEQVGMYINVGAVFDSLKCADIPGFGLPVPPLPEQRAIAHILGTLDNKIELNRQMNQTLEEMARALFKSWFVEFDPVHAKATLKDHATTLPQAGSDWSVDRARAYLDGMDPDIAALFPDSLVDSALGPIPEGWEVRALGECFEVERGLSYKGSALSSFGVPMHNLNSIFEGGGYKNDGIKYYRGDYRPRHVVQPGDVIVANTEQGHDRMLIGFAAIVPKCFGDNGLFSHHIYRVRTKSSFAFAPDFVCRLLNTQAIHDTVSGYATGTTVNMLPVDALRIPRFVAPLAQVVTTFSTIAEEARVRQEAFIAESRTLAIVRDTLLPKLISGKMRVKDEFRH